MMLIIAFAASAAFAEGPHIGYVYPAGGQQGTVVQVTAGGQNLRGVSAVYVTGDGVRGAVIRHVPQVTNKVMREIGAQVRDLILEKRGKAAKAAAKAGETPQDAKARVAASNHPIMQYLQTLEPDALEKAAKDLLEMNKKRQINPQLSETAILEITIDPGAQVGEREVRFMTSTGLTNPLWFHVGALPEVSESEPFGLDSPVTPVPCVPVALNGQIMPGDVDRFRFNASGGQKLVVDVKARALMPYLADAVPGWFQAVLALYDAKGEELAYADDYAFDPDPRISYEFPADGEYTLEIRDSIYRGREDFVYRMTVADNVPPRPYTCDIPNADVRDEDEKNNRIRGAEHVKVPVTVAGTIAKPGDVDIFKIKGKAGEEIVAEVFARRMGSPLDSLLRITDAEGNVLEWNDDHEDKSAGLTTHHADSYVRAKCPKTGTYYAQLSDAQGQGGDQYSYKLSLRPPAPDFALRITPSTINVPAGRRVPIYVYAFRKDGFDGDIGLALKDAPKGFVLDGARIPKGRDSVRVTLSAAAKSSEPVALHLEGAAEIDGVTVTREVVPAEDMMQAFAYRHLVPCRQLMAAVQGQGRAPAVSVAGDTPIRIAAGGAAEVRINAPKLPMPADVKLALSDPPKGFSIENVSVAPEGMAFTIRTDGACVKPPFADNLIVEAYTEKAEARKHGKQAQASRKTSLGVLPAIPIEVVQP